MSERTLISIRDGSIGYTQHKTLLQKINFSVHSKDRIVIQGNNASGKSSFIKAILGEKNIIKSGDWLNPKFIDIGYLDQHYLTLKSEITVLETIEELQPNWSHLEIRRHLIDFLFRKNEEIHTQVKYLSGGEKARLSLAQIAAYSPKLLILDEITNNLDLETKEHVIQVLKAYPGAIIVISHDSEFINKIDINHFYQIVDGQLTS